MTALRRTLLATTALLAATALAVAQHLPPIDHPVNDFAGVLSAEQVTKLDEQLLAHRAASGVQLAVLLVDTTDGEPIEDYALRAAVAWGGGERRKDDGALFVMAVKDRRMRLEVGYGLEALVPDAAAASLLEELKPFLRESDYDGAMAHLVEGLTRRTAAGVAAPPAPAIASSPLPAGLREALALVNWPWVLAFFGSLFLGRWLRRRHGYPKGVELSEGTHLSVPQTIVAVSVLIGVVTALSGVLGFGWGLWWGATQGVLVGAFALHDAEAPTWLLYVGVLGVVTVAMELMWDVPLDRFLFGVIAQGAVSVLALIVAVMDSTTESSFSSSGVSSWSSRSHGSSLFGSSSFGSSSRSSSFGSSSRSSSSFGSSSSGSSRSSGGYRGGGGGFGGGGASSSW